jgi:radical SAM protein with 4Fe4S-binding SPASM domain
MLLGVDEVVCSVPALSEHGVDEFWESGLVPVEVEIPNQPFFDATFQKKSEFVTANNVRIRYYQDECSECPGLTMCAITCPYNWTIQSMNRAEYGSVHCHNRPTCNHYGSQSWWQQRTTGGRRAAVSIIDIDEDSGQARVKTNPSLTPFVDGDSACDCFFSSSLCID